MVYLLMIKLNDMMLFSHWNSNFKVASHGQAAARTTVGASRTISENASIFDREQLWQNLNNQVMVEFNQAFEARLRRHLGPYLR